MIKFTNTNQIYIEEAVQLASNEYQAECSKNPHLIQTEFKECLTNMLGWLFQNQYGKVALLDGKVIGYLAFAGPWDGFHGNVKGAFSPLGGSAFTGNNRSKLASMLFEQAASDMAKDGVCQYAISRYAHDEEVAQSFILNGFGIRCSDGIMHLTDRKTVDNMDSKLEFCELTGKEKYQVEELKRGLVRHLASAPAFFPTNLELFAQKYYTDETRLFAVKDQNQVIGYIAAEEEDSETFVSGYEKMANICGAFFLPEYRSKGLAAQLLEYVCQTFEKEGYEYLGVDRETMNPTALHFWTKYFTSYTYSFIRRLDERVIGFQDYMNQLWKDSNF